MARPPQAHDSPGASLAVWGLALLVLALFSFVGSKLIETEGGIAAVMDTSWSRVLFWMLGANFPGCWDAKSNFIPAIDLAG